MVHMIRKKLCYDTREGIIHIFENECKAVCVQNKILGCVCTQFVYFIKKNVCFNVLSYVYFLFFHSPQRCTLIYSSIWAARSHRPSSCGSSTNTTATFSWLHSPSAQFSQQSQSKQHRSVSLYRMATAVSMQVRFSTCRTGNTREHPSPHPKIKNDPLATIIIGIQSSTDGASPTHMNKMINAPAVAPDRTHKKLTLMHNLVNICSATM